MKFRPYIIPGYAENRPLLIIWDCFWEAIARTLCRLGLHGAISTRRDKQPDGRTVKTEEKCMTCYWKRSFRVEEK